MNNLSQTIRKYYDYFYGLKQINPFLGYPLNNQETYRPFFIIGSGRCGSTLLRRILYSYPNFHIPPETYVLKEVIQTFKQNRHLSWKHLVYLTLSTLEYHPEFQTFKIDSLRDLVHEITEISDHQRSLAAILNNFYLYHARLNGKNCYRWGDKTPINTFCLEDIATVFPDAQFIHIIRDGCDVVSSMIECGRYSKIEDAANRWINSIQYARSFRQLSSKNYLEIKYEMLVTETEEVVKKICSFLTTDYTDYKNTITSSENILISMGDVLEYKHHNNVQKPIMTSGISKGRSKLNYEEKLFLQSRIGFLLEELGYDRCL